jgi:hypothetical protein
MESALTDTSEKSLRMRTYQNVFLEFKRVLVWKGMLVISEYKTKIRLYTFAGQRYYINKDVEELALSFNNWL